MADGQEVGRVSIRVVPDTSNFRRRLKEELQVLDKLDAVLEVTPDTTGFRQKVAAVTKGMRAAVELDVNRSAISRLRGAIADKLSNIPEPKFMGINVAGAGLAGLGATLALAGPAVGLLTTALAALPGLLAAVATPVAAITLGLDGLKAAAARLKAPFEDLKKTLSAFTEQQFTPVFTKLGDIFPTLAKSLPAVTQGVADMARSLVDTVTSGDGIAKIQETIGNIGKALSGAAPGIGAFTNGLLSLANSFSAKLPGIAEWFNKLGDSFNNWVTKISSDGTLSKAFDGLGATLKTVLESLGPLLEKGMDFMGDPAKIEKFNTALSGLGALLKSAMNDSIAFYGVLQDIKNVFTGFDFSNIWADLTAPFTSADAPWRTMWADLQSGAQSAWASITGVVSSAVSTISALFQSVPQRFSAAWTALTGIAQQAWEGVKSAVIAAWNGITQAVAEGVARVVAFVAELPGRIVGAIGNLGGLLVGAGRALMDGLLSGIRAGLQSVLDFASGIADKIAAVKGPLPYDRKVLTPAGEALMQGLDDGMQSGFDDIIAKTKAMAKAIFEAFKEVFGNDGPALGFSLAPMQNQMSTIATQAEGLSKSYNSAVTGSVPVQKMSAETKELMAQLNLEEARLDLEKKKLAVQKAQTTDKTAKAEIQSQIDALDLQKKQFAVQEQALKLSQSYTGETQSQVDMFKAMARSGEQALQMPMDFAKASGQQLMSDLGMSGNGALPAIAQYAANYGQGVVNNFYTNSVDDQIAAYNNARNKEALQYYHR